MGNEAWEYRIVYNWGKSAHEMCEVYAIGDNKPHAYTEANLYTHDDDSAIDNEPSPVGRLRVQLQDMLAACDKPVLRFPEDFDG